MKKSKVSVLPEIPESIDNSFKNLTDLPTKGIGQTLADCWYLVFGGISQSAEKKHIKYAIELENFKNELQASISSVPENVRKEPSSQIVLAALDNAKYCVEEKELRDMFTTLITSSINSTQIVHPSFSHIISQMSPTDAIMFKYLLSKPEFPICDIIHANKDHNVFDALEINVFLDGPEQISFQDKSLAISSLLSHGLVESPEDMAVYPPSSYDKFEFSEPYISLLRKYPAEELQFERKVIRITNLGKLFASCCITK